MIAKNIKGKSFAGCVRYVMNDTSEILEAEGVLAETAESVIQSFNIQMMNRHDIKQPVGHIPISFSPEDKPRMTNDFMLQLAKEYMSEMGIKNTQYIIVRHHNTKHDHLHIVYNRIDNEQKLISVSNDYKRNIKTCKKLKDKYGLTYGKGDVKKADVSRENLHGEDKIKYEIRDAIYKALLVSPNMLVLQMKLRKEGVNLVFKYRRGTDIIEGVSFEKGGHKYKGSDIDRMFSYGHLKKMVELVRKQYEPYIKRMQEAQARKDVQENDSRLQHNDGMRPQHQETNKPSDVSSDPSALEAVGEMAADILSGLGGLLNTHGEDFQEAEFRNRMNREEALRKKKKRRGPHL